MTEQSDFISLLEKSSWKDNDNSIWLASSLKLYRNIANYFFPSKLDGVKQKQLLSLIKKAIFSSSMLKNPVYIDSQSTKPLDKQFLFEHFLSNDGFFESDASEAFIIDDSGQFFLQLNVKDHLRIQKIDCRGELEACWNDLTGIESDISKSLTYAFNSRFGFLTSEINHCGTGFKGHVYLHLPLLIHSGKIHEILQNDHDNIITYRGMRGEVNEFVGDIVILYNKTTIGVSEEEILNNLRSTLTKLMTAEKTLRGHLEEDFDHQIKNKVSRAYAFAFHSYEFDVIESLNALSLCKLGIDLKWIEGVDHKTLNNLLFNTNRGHLLSLNKDIKQEDVPHVRAELIHQAFKNTKLLI
jgi:protein arginine kinase